MRDLRFAQPLRGDPQWRCSLRHCTTSRKVAGSIPDIVIGIFHPYIPSGLTMALGLTQPLTEMCTRNISWRIKMAGACGWQPYHLHVQIVMKCGSLNLLEPSVIAFPVTASTQNGSHSLITAVYQINRYFDTSIATQRRLMSDAVAFSFPLTRFMLSKSFIHQLMHIIVALLKEY